MAAKRNYPSQRNSSAVLPNANKKKTGLDTQLAELGFIESGSGANRTYHRNGKVVKSTQKKIRTSEDDKWRYYTNYNKKEYISFGSSAELLSYITGGSQNDQD